MSWLTPAAGRRVVNPLVGRLVTGALLSALTLAGLLPAECGEPLLANLLKLFGW